MTITFILTGAAIIFSAFLLVMQKPRRRVLECGPVELSDVHVTEYSTYDEILAAVLKNEPPC